MGGALRPDFAVRPAVRRGIKSLHHPPRHVLRPSSIIDRTRPGRHRHYQGNDRLVIVLTRHSETLEPPAVYQALHGERGLWVRPAAMFADSVEFAGQRVPRFAFVGAVLC